MQLLQQLLSVDSPSGDDDVMSDWLEDWAASHLDGVRTVRLGESLVVIRGEPRTAVFAHIDTTGFTLGHRGKLIRIGSPAVHDGDKLRTVGCDGPAVAGTIRVRGDDWKFVPQDAAALPLPGTRLVYAGEPVVDTQQVVSPYLDNRGGIWAALTVLQRSTNVAVAFTACEEHSAKGASICARYLYTEVGVRQALISDLTWDTADIHCGGGVAISLRDSLVPRQRFLETVRGIAAASGVKHQLEVESAGGSDGGAIQRCGLPMDWAFVGAPEKAPHSAAETAVLSDLEAMADLLTILVRELPARVDD